MDKKWFWPTNLLLFPQTLDTITSKTLYEIGLIIIYFFIQIVMHTFYWLSRILYLIVGNWYLNQLTELSQLSSGHVNYEPCVGTYKSERRIVDNWPIRDQVLSSRKYVRDNCNFWLLTIKQWSTNLFKFFLVQFLR